jgi:hypothetical protein
MANTGSRGISGNGVFAKYLLIWQWSGGTEADFEALIALEDLLLFALPDGDGVVDGHDFGAGEMNIFVQTDRPVEAFQHAMAALGSHPRRDEVRAAYREADGEMFVVLWPKGLETFTVA